MTHLRARYVEHRGKAVSGGLHIRAPHDRAAHIAAQHGFETFGREDAKRLAHWRPADAELLGKHVVAR